MTDTPAPDVPDAPEGPEGPEGPKGPDLGEIHDEIEELAAQPAEELISPTPRFVEEREPTPEPTDAIGSEDWDDPA